MRRMEERRHDRLEGVEQGIRCEGEEVFRAVIKGCNP